MQAIIEELGGEKIDIIEWNEKAEKFIAAAISPAKVLNVTLNEDRKEAKVSVPEDQLSLAIGKQGQNVRLAAKLTGWKIDVIGAVAKAQAEEVITEDVPVAAAESADAEPKELKTAVKKAKKTTKKTAEKEELAA